MPSGMPTSDARPRGTAVPCSAGAHPPPVSPSAAGLCVKKLTLMYLRPRLATYAIRYRRNAPARTANSAVRVIARILAPLRRASSARESGWKGFLATPAVDVVDVVDVVIVLVLPRACARAVR